MLAENGLVVFHRRFYLFASYIQYMCNILNVLIAVYQLIIKNVIID